MNKNFLLLTSVTVALALSACASAPRPIAVSPACAALSDSLSKYVSATVTGCSVLSKYNLVIKPTA